MENLEKAQPLVELNQFFLAELGMSGGTDRRSVATEGG